MSESEYRGSWKMVLLSFLGALLAVIVVAQIGLWATGANVPPDFGAAWVARLGPFVWLLYILAGFFAAYFAYTVARGAGAASVFIAALVVGGSGGPEGLVQFTTLGIVMLLGVIYFAGDSGLEWGIRTHTDGWVQSRPAGATSLTKYPDGTTYARVYPFGTLFERSADTEPTFEVWRDPEGNVIERPDRELYPEMPHPPIRDIPEEKKRNSERRAREWVRSGKGKELSKRRAEKERRETGLSPEEYQRYRKAIGEYHAKLWQPGPARRPQPEDFKGTSPS